MLRDLLSSRAILAGLVFVVVVVAGTQLYSWHVRRTSEAELERHDRLLQELKKQNEARPAQAVNVPTDTETPGFVNTDTPRSHETEALHTETETLDLTNAFLPDDMVSEEAPAEEVPVSPFGFGQYPEVPDDYPWGSNEPKFWKNLSMDGELLNRVLIKIWTDDPGSISGGSNANINGQLRVYPHYHDAIYLEWADHIGLDGKVKRRYVSGSVSGLPPDISFRIAETGEVPAGIRALNYETDGLDPYNFLDLLK